MPSESVTSATAGKPFGALHAEVQARSSMWRGILAEASELDFAAVYTCMMFILISISISRLRVTVCCACSSHVSTCSFQQFWEEIYGKHSYGIEGWQSGD